MKTDRQIIYMDRCVDYTDRQIRQIIFTARHRDRLDKQTNRQLDRQIRQIYRQIDKKIDKYTD